MELIGHILWYAMFATPLLTIPLVWRLKETSKMVRVIIGISLAMLLSFCLYHISLQIIFRDGMGPG